MEIRAITVHNKAGGGNSPPTLLGSRPATLFCLVKFKFYKSKMVLSKRLKWTTRILFYLKSCESSKIDRKDSITLKDNYCFKRKIK